jgi:hypothetical protein
VHNGRRVGVNLKRRVHVSSIEPFRPPIPHGVKKNKIKEVGFPILPKLDTDPTKDVGFGKTRLDLKTKEITK